MARSALDEIRRLPPTGEVPGAPPDEPLSPEAVSRP